MLLIVVCIALMISNSEPHHSSTWSASIGLDWSKRQVQIHGNHWTTNVSYVSQYHSKYRHMTVAADSESDNLITQSPVSTSTDNPVRNR